MMKNTEWIYFDADARAGVVRIDYECRCGEGYEEPAEGWDIFLHAEGERMASILREKFPNATVSVEFTFGESGDYEVFGLLSNGDTVLLVSDPFETILNW